MHYFYIFKAVMSNSLDILCVKLQTIFWVVSNILTCLKTIQILNTHIFLNVILREIQISVNKLQKHNFFGKVSLYSCYKGN